MAVVLICGNCGCERGTSAYGCRCVPEEFWQRLEVQAALESRDVTRIVRLLRTHTDLSQDALARMTGLSQGMLSQMESGRRSLRSAAKKQRALDGLGAPGVSAELVRYADPAATERGGDRGELVQAEVESAKGTLAWLSDELQRLERDYDIASSAVVLAEAGQLHGTLKRVAARGESAAESLLRLRARSALLMGQLVWDASHRRDGSTATTFFDEAALTARECRDRSTAAQAQLRRSFVPLYGDGDPRDALISAHRAANTAVHLPQIQALATLHISEAHARLGQRGDAERHLAEADRLAERADLNEADWSGRSRRIAGSVYLALGMPERAQPLLEEAIPLVHGHTKSQAIVVANLALAQVRQSRLTEATTVLHQAMDLVEVTRAGGALTLIATASRELGRWRSEPLVTEAHERLFTLLAS